MDYSKVAIVVVITLVIVILFNLAIFSSFGRNKGNKPGTVDMLRSAFKTARNPWKDEDTALKELSERVEALKENKEGEEDRN